MDQRSCPHLENLAKRDSQCREIWPTRGKSQTQEEKEKLSEELLEKKTCKTRCFSSLRFVHESPF